MSLFLAAALVNSRFKMSSAVNAGPFLMHVFRIWTSDHWIATTLKSSWNSELLYFVWQLEAFALWSIHVASLPSP